MTASAEERCFVCGGELEARPGRPYRGCRRCGHEVRIADPGATDSLVNEVLDPARLRSQDLKTRFQTWLVRRAAQRFGEVWDIGAGPGRLLHHLRGVFRRQLGVEPTPACLRLARDTLGLEVEPELRSAHAQRRPDVVTMWHSLEHLTAPTIARYLETIRAALPEHGRLIVSVPSASGLHFRLFGTNSVYYDPVYHHHQFTERSLVDLLRAHGFEPLEFSTAFSYSYFGALLSLVNLLTPHNHLYRRLQRGERGSSEVWTALGLASSAVFAGPALAWYAFELVCPRQGAVLTVVFAPQSA